MTARRSWVPPPTKLLSWAITAAAVGWLVVYNVLRVGGQAPDDAWLVSLGPGIALGAGLFAAALLVRRSRAGRPGQPDPGPPSTQEQESRRDAVRLAAIAVGALAAVSLVTGVLEVADWYGDDPSSRAVTTAILGLWNLLLGAWLVAEAPQLYKGDIEGLDSIALGALLAAVLAGVALSRDLVSVAQVLLIIVAGLAAGAGQLAIWRLQGARGAPISAAVVVIVAALALVLPIVG